jgi:hypothetical protein
MLYFLRRFRLANQYSDQLRAGRSGARIPIGQEVSLLQNAHNIFGGISAFYSTYAVDLSQYGQCPERKITHIHLVPSLRMAEAILCSLYMLSYRG